jgi:hypothetical protein
VSERGAAAGRAMATGVCALVCACVAAAPAPQRDRAPTLALSGAHGAMRLSNSHAGSAIVAADGMKPGDVAAGSVTVANRGEGVARLVLASSRPRDHPGPGGGRLSRRLEMRVSDLAGARHAEGAANAMAGCHPLGRLAAGQARTFRFEVRFAGGTRDDNAYARSAASIDESWIARRSGGCGAQEVLAEQRGSGGSDAPLRPSPLPFTGLQVLLVAILGAAALAAGLALRRAIRRSTGRRRRFAGRERGRAERVV